MQIQTIQVQTTQVLKKIFKRLFLKKKKKKEKCVGLTNINLPFLVFCKIINGFEI